MHLWIIAREVTAPAGCLVEAQPSQTPEKMDLNGESWKQLEAAVISMGKLVEGTMLSGFQLSA